ncbi:MAG: glycosyltransferase family 4 protein [Nostoc sp. ZfuVER08]|uniref:Glycosyltransferase n=1 Tax=Nostoc punctiforme FACHB-252 TaxID=1357509 RepID=A0ABR8HIL4_NOSPU|nr:glycosyltransferase [Nostoc punctiforme]MBD2614923.1 glycosyltransferase [Nostoc punctiforme FACHB-252]MDZ8013460.1 glycosyltransferase [Nostoc sp. ZfuVER08]
MKIIYIITGLSTGGAEVMLYKLLSKMDKQRFSPVVVSLMDGGTWGDRIANLGIPVYTIGMQPGIVKLINIWRLIQLIRQLKPDLIQGWMYHGNLAAQFVRLFIFRQVPVFWNVRHSLHSLELEKPSTNIIIKLCAQFSQLPTKIIYNSHNSAKQHEKIGYCLEKTCVIPNGFETEKFTPSTADRLSVRSELNTPEDALLIGLIGRYHPIKDHFNFLQAAALLLKNYTNVQFVLIGNKVDWENQILSELIHELELVKHIHLLGERHDVPRLTAALDIACSSSSGEGFSNVIGEAMSCGVPCVVTDVGDSGWIVDDTGKVVSPRNPQALANAWEKLINMGKEGRESLGKAARARVIKCFSLDSIVAEYETLYDNVFAEKNTTIQTAYFS